MKKIKKIFSLVIIVVFLILQPFHNIIEISAQEVGNDVQELLVYKKAIIVSEEKVPLYDNEPPEISNILTYLENDDEVTVLEEFNEFSQVRFENEDTNEIYDGYIENKYLNIIPEENETNSELTTGSTNQEVIPPEELNQKNSKELPEENGATTNNNFTTFNALTLNSPLSQESLQGIALKDKTHVYKTESRNNGILKSYNQGTLLKFKTWNADWYEATVKINDKWHTGYIHRTDVEIPVKVQETLRGIALQNPTKIYKRASANSGTWRTYPVGSVLKYKTFSKNFYQASVKINGKWQTGYIHKNHVENVNTKQETLRGIALQSATKVYKRASTNSSTWRTYPVGSVLKYKTFSKNFYQASVKINGKWQTGYIHKNHVENAVQKQSTLRGVAIQKPTRIYKRASTNSSSWKNYSQGNILKYKTFSTNWYEATVKVNGKWQTGYIHRSHVDNLVDKQQTVHGLALKSPTRAYSLPATNSTVLKSYKIGSNIKYKTFSRNWYQATVIVNGKKRNAYFHKNHVGERRQVNYNVTLNQALNAQMAARPKTTFPEMYVPKTALKQVEENGKKVWKVNGQNIAVRNEPKSNAKIIGTIDERYINDTITVRSSHGNFYRFSTWIIATKEDTLKYLNPNRYKSNDFIFLKLNRSTGVSASEVNNKILKGKGILEGRASAFINASKQHNINEIYLISHAILETGHGTSDLAKGIQVGIDKNGKHVLVTNGNKSTLKNIKTTYNMFGIGAKDSCKPNPRTCGAIRAYQEGWFSPNAAITGGAKFIATDYIHNGQDTLYKMRWNPDAIAANGSAKHQYATDIAWAEKQSNIIKEFYNQLNSYQLTFEVPKYK